MRLHNLGRSAINGLAARIIPIASSLFISWSLANFAGLSLLGQYAFALITMQVACGNATLGIDGSLFRLLIRRPKLRTPVQINRVMSASYATTGAVAFALMAVAVTVGLVLIQTGSWIQGVFFLQLAPMPLGFSRVRTSIGALRVSGKIASAQWLDGVIPAVLAAAAAAMALAIRPAWLIYVPAATTIGWLANGYLARALVARQYGKAPRSRPSFRAMIRLIKVSVPQQSVNIVNYIGDWLPVLAIGVFLTSRDMGIFRIVSQLALPIQMINTTVEFPSSTVIAKHYGASEFEQSRKGLRNARFLMVAAAFPVAVAILALSPWMLSNFFKIDDQFAVWCLLALLCGQLGNAIAGPVASTLASIGSSRVLFTSSAAALACSLLLLPTLGSAFGLVGICAGVAAAWMVRAAINRRHVVMTLVR